MTTCVTETPIALTFLFGAVGLGSVFAFLMTRRAKHLWWLAGAVLLTLLAWGIHLWVETDREQVERKGREVAAAAERGDVEALKELFSPTFYMPEYPSRDDVLQVARRFLPPNQSRRIEFWSFQVETTRDARLITATCSARGSGQFGPFRTDQDYIGSVHFTFVKDQDGQWRIKRFKVVNIGGHEYPLPR
jgi:hypothetical protein